MTLRRILLLIMEAVALHDFTAHHTNEDELPFTKGSILKVKFQINRSKIYGFNSFTCFRASQEVGDKPDLIVRNQSLLS